MKKKKRAFAVDADFVAFVTANETRLLGLACKYTRNVDDARDLLQETYLKVIEKFGDFDGRNLAGWLHAILRTTWVDGYRRTRRHMRLNSYLARDDMQEDSAELSVVLRDVIDIIGRLPAIQRRTLTAHTTMGYRYRDIAKRQRMPLGTVKSTIARARAALAEAM